MKTISSEHVGVCVDTGNSIALLGTADGDGGGRWPRGRGRAT